MNASPDAEFAQFYQQYPRKRGRLDAEKAWAQAARREPNLLALCLAALAWQLESPEWLKDGGEFVPYPATYLRAGRFYDEPTKKMQSASQKAQDVKHRAAEQQALEYWRKKHAAQAS